MQVHDNDDFHDGQRSSEDKLCKFKMMMMTFMEVKGQMGSKYSKLCSLATNLVRRSLMAMRTFIEVKGQQRPNVAIYSIWLPHLIRCTANYS